MRLLLHYSLCSALFALSACATTPQAPVNLPVSDMARGAYSQLQTERLQLIQNTATLQQLWQQAQVSRPVPEVDFSQYSVVLVALGARPTGGYRVDVSSVVKTANGITVNVTIHKPGDKCVVTQVVTNPYHFARVPIARESDLTVDFTVVDNTIQCGG